jgi:hypothetical protein
MEKMKVADLDGYSVNIIPIGKGAFGKVYKVKKDDTGEIYAYRL